MLFHLALVIVVSLYGTADCAKKAGNDLSDQQRQFDIATTPPVVFTALLFLKLFALIAVLLYNAYNYYNKDQRQPVPSYSNGQPPSYGQLR
jgi:hypothetical protein